VTSPDYVAFSNIDEVVADFQVTFFFSLPYFADRQNFHLQIAKRQNVDLQIAHHQNVNLQNADRHIVNFHIATCQNVTITY
jgi:hypothetical protein